MNTHRIAAIALAATLAGLTHAPAAEENISATTDNDIYRQTAADQKPEMGSFMPETDMPAQTESPPAENLLSVLKIYPSF